MKDPPASQVSGSGIGAAVAANRGASGIDGVMSAAAGFAYGLSRGATLVVGDISFLHDVNGLNLLRTGAILYGLLCSDTSLERCSVLSSKGAPDSTSQPFYKGSTSQPQDIRELFWYLGPWCHVAITWPSKCDNRKAH